MSKEHNIEQLLDDFSSSEPESSSKEKKTDIDPEIDDLLQETLSEFGLNLDKNRPSLRTEEEKPKPPAVQEVKDIKLPENGPLSEYTQPTKKPFKFLFPYFKLSSKKLKIPAPKILLPLIALIIIAGSSAFYIFKPHKINSTPAQTVVVKKPETEQQLGQLPPERNSLEKLLKQEKDTASSELSPPLTSAQSPSQQPGESPPTLPEKMKTEEQSPTEPISTSEKTPSSQESSAINLPSEYTEPYLEAAPPELELQQLSQAKKETDLFNEQLKQPKKVNSSFFERYFLVEKKEPEQSSPPKKAPALGIKLGDLVPLQMVDFPPRIIRQVQPEYPSAALDIGLEGTVLINALISENGDVIKAIVLKGVKSEFGLNKSALNAVKQWKFRPALKDGIRVKVWKPIAIAFKKKLRS